MRFFRNAATGQSPPSKVGYVVEPLQTFCSSSLLIAYVHSAPNHLLRRNTIRDTWGNPRNFPGFRVIFVLGRVDDNRTMDSILMESEMYGDVLVADFLDTYKNLTLKAVSAVTWMSNHCSNVKYILKTDDDIFVNLFTLIDQLKLYSNIKNSFLCLVWNRMKVVREKRSKWYISKEEFEKDIFPTYCSGSAYILTSGVVGKLATAAKDVGFFWVDDFYVTGLLAKRSGVSYVQLNPGYVLSPTTFYEKFTEVSSRNKLIFGHVQNVNEMKAVWKIIHRDRARWNNSAAGL
ncbi:unnamed protein product [Dimorphilus gyrociliatus]|uniref:Hexosyltransferase n=1 Tax=Dimorphilus gyrociliatus TaxID=2664684 RepID=A0A7I8VR01_9ANNE|nr:unnamed protein product [Dimorphilus gyrociliatus]